MFCKNAVIIRYICDRAAIPGAGAGGIAAGGAALVGIGALEASSAMAAAALAGGPAGVVAVGGVLAVTAIGAWWGGKNTANGVAEFVMSSNYYNFTANIKFCRTKKTFYAERIEQLYQEIENIEEDKKDLEKCITDELKEYNKCKELRCPENMKKVEKDLQKKAIALHQSMINKILQEIKDINLNNEKLTNDIPRFEKEIEDNYKQLKEYKDCGEYLYKIIKCLGIGSKLIHQEGNLVKFVECYDNEYCNKAENYSFSKDKDFNNSFNSSKLIGTQLEQKLTKSGSFKMLISEIEHTEKQQDKSELQINKDSSNKLHL